jgi:ABC-type glycerol-3-phosphate transport system substrate-binding protein
MKRVLLFGAAVCLLAALAGCSTSTKTAKKDVTITACTASPTGDHPSAAGTIVNHSSKASAYTIHVKFKDDSGNDVGDGVSGVAKVDPNATAKWSATSTVNHKGAVKCSLSTVTRNAVPTA